jgi:hypothetical protein
MEAEGAALTGVAGILSAKTRTIITIHLGVFMFPAFLKKNGYSHDSAFEKL